MTQEGNSAGHKGYCFVIMSFGEDSALQDCYELVVRPVVENLGLDCVRADEIQHNQRITDMVIDKIRDAAFIIVDLTDERPNCYYELGYAHALGKHVIHIAEEQTAIHFDVKDYNFILYSRSRMRELRTQLRKRIEDAVLPTPGVVPPPVPPDPSSPEPKLEILRRQLEDESIAVRARAVSELRDMGAPAVHLLTKASRDEKPGIWNAAFEALVEIGKPAVQPLVRALSDYDLRTVIDDRTIDALGKIGEPAIPTLLEALGGPFVSRALGAIGEPAVPALVEVLRDENPHVRSGAASALGLIGEAAEGAVHVLMEILHDENSSVRESAVKALGRIGKPARVLFPR